MEGCPALLLTTAAIALLGCPNHHALGAAPSTPLHFIYPTDCSTFNSDTVLPVNLSIAHGLSPGDCVTVHIRHSKDKVWWFLTPPTPLKDTQQRLCVGRDLELSGSVQLGPGYTMLTAWWDQPRESKERPPAHATVLVSVSSPGEDRSDLPNLARQGREERDGHLLEDAVKSQELSAKYRPLAKHKWLQGATAATAGLLDPRLARALRDGSPRALWSVLEDAEELLECPEADDEDVCEDCERPPPQTLVGNRDRWTPWQDEAPIDPPVVYRIPLFTLEASEMLLQELQAANASALAAELTQPQNPDGHGRAPGSAPGAVMLAEVGLGPLVESLVQDVLAPISRLVYPQWGGDTIDSWQGFSIHARVPFPEEQRRMVRQHVDTADKARLRKDLKGLGRSLAEVESIMARDDFREEMYKLATSTFKEHGWLGGVGNQMGRACRREDPGHTDVCELTLNICLGRNFSRNGVFFGGYSGLHGRRDPVMWVPHVPGTAYVSICQRQHGVVGPAWGERHSVVVRAMSSQIRGAPAESFAVRCMQ